LSLALGRAPLIMVFQVVLHLLVVLQGFVRLGLPFVLGLFLAPACPRLQDEARPKDAGYQEASAPAPPPFEFRPSPGSVSVALPRAERLVYKVSIDLGVTSAMVGTVTQTCTVATQEVPLMLAQAGTAAGDACSIKLFAKGEALGYTLESTLETRILPQEWPRLYYQQSSETSRGLRRREVMVGHKEGAPVSSYRGDTSKGAPEGQRIWRAERVRAVPEGTIDMLTAVFMARTLIREKVDTLSFPLIDTDRLWLLSLRRGEERVMETEAGTFDAVEVVLQPAPYAGEALAEKAAQFEGVFGIQGSIHLWVDKKSGLAVRIQGVLPVGNGLIKLGIDVVLDSYSGTPAAFGPLPKDPKKR
jgi:hypothetical protein